MILNGSYSLGTGFGEGRSIYELHNLWICVISCVHLCGQPMRFARKCPIGHYAETVELVFSYLPCSWAPLTSLILPEPGICRGNEDSCGNENRKWWEQIFSVGKKHRQAYFFF